MLRRVARALRIGLFVLGILSLVWLPISLQYSALITHEFSDRWHGIWVGGSWLVLWTTDLLVEPGTAWHFERHDGRLGEFDTPLWPPVHSLEAVHGTLHFMKIPLWLLSVLFLAWPVTSFIVARRRRRSRGFEVEAKAGGAVSTSDS